MIPDKITLVDFFGNKKTVDTRPRKIVSISKETYQKIVMCVESMREYSHYFVKSFDVVDQRDNIYILQNILLEGKHLLSSDGKVDGQPSPQLIAPSYLPYAGFVIKLEETKAKGLR